MEILGRQSLPKPLYRVSRIIKCSIPLYERIIHHKRRPRFVARALANVERRPILYRGALG
jgi:hypothetical protein